MNARSSGRALERWSWPGSVGFGEASPLAGFETLYSCRTHCAHIAASTTVFFFSFVVGAAGSPMAPPRDTAGSTTPHQQPQPADAPGRYNQKSTTFRNGTTESGWFYPTPAALKAAADVRGARSAREFF